MQELPKDRKMLEMGAIILAAANASEERLLSLARQLPGYRPGISLPTFLYSFLMREYHMSLAEIAGLDDRQIIAFVSDWVAVKAALAPQAESPARPLKQPPRMTTALANAKAMKLAKADPRFVHRTQRAWADAIGCSVGLISRLSFWREVAKKTGRARRGKAPLVVNLTDKLLATTAGRDAALKRLTAEQWADHEPSPLEDRQAIVKNRKWP